MNTRELRQRLIEQRKRLQTDRERSEGLDMVTPQPDGQSGELSGIDQHPADEGTETFERERVLAIMEQIDARLEEVDAALARLDRGDFGSCGICGDAIPEERLAVRPEARYCVKHQEEVERGAHPPSPSS